jgi:PhoPQ-activated pathogenicity-related protein
MLRSPLPLVVLMASVTCVGPARADLAEYVRTPDASFAWKLKKKVEGASATIYEIHLVSQTWHDITWEHELQVFVPTGCKPGARMVLWNTGGKPGPNTVLTAIELAEKIGAPVAFLFGIPNQPLLPDKKEDALIAETFVRALKEKDGTWPLLLPMVKSLVRAMDALQAFAKEEWKLELKEFVVSGASKRGWTTWLTAAVDGRVRAIIPIVFDSLNMKKQLPHQLESYGKYSEMIADYTKRGLAPPPDTPEGRKLWALVDPWAYRDHLTLPKLIVNGANDPYWTGDALNLYWDDLKGDKWVLYVPNAGHNLQQNLGDGKSNVLRATNTIAAFARHQVRDKPFPKLSWKHTGDGPTYSIAVESSIEPKTVRIWCADASTRDFRKSTWTAHPATLSKGNATSEVKVPEKGYRIFFAECEYESEGLRYYLSTQPRIVGR